MEHGRENRCEVCERPRGHVRLNCQKHENVLAAIQIFEKNALLIYCVFGTALVFHFMAIEPFGITKIIKDIEGGRSMAAKSLIDSQGR